MNKFGIFLLGYLLAVASMFALLYFGYPEIITIIMMHTVPPPML